MDRKIQKQELKEILERTEPQHINKEFMTNVLRTIKSTRNITPQEVAKMILFLADFPEKNWNIKAIMESLKVCLEEINWRDVYSCFLDADFNIWSLESLYLIIDCWICISGIITVPYEIFFKKWKNLRAQIYFLRLIIESDEKKTQLYSNVFFRKIIKLEETRNSRFKGVLNYESNFNCVELFECIKMLDSVVLIELIARKSPDWCLAGLSYIQPSFEKIFDDLTMNLMRASSNSFIFYVLFRNSPTIVLNRVRKYLGCGISLSKILDILLEHKMLPFISDHLEPPDVCLDILILSSKRDHLNLNIWLTNNISSKKDAFAKCLILYMENKIQSLSSVSHLNKTEVSQIQDKSNTLFDPLFGNKESKSVFNDSVQYQENLMVDKLFPLSIDLIHSFIKVIDQYQKHLSYDTLTHLNHLKKQIPHAVKIKKGLENNVDEQASSFISSIINSQTSITEGLEQILEYQKGDSSSKELSYRIFSTLINNYNTLYKLPNSDMLAKFYGELIKDGIISKPYLKVALSHIKGSLLYPETEREFYFAFKCLEVFIRSMPKFLAEVEEIEQVKNNLLKRELILVDENFYSKLSIQEFFKMSFKSDDAVSNIKAAEMYSFLKRKLSMKDFDFVSYLKERQEELIFLIYYLIRTLYNEDIDTVFQIANRFDSKQKTKFIYECLNVPKILLNFQIDNEIEFTKKIGCLLGKLTLAQNKLVTLDKFDFKGFLISSVECRRITLGVTFICNYIKQGKDGLIFVPNNPWLMALLSLLSELHTCTLKMVRNEIEQTFVYFNVLLEPKPVKSFKFKTKDYLSEYILKSDDPVLKHVISLALDFSVREISEHIIEKACEIAIRTGVVLFKTIKVEKGNEYVLFRNLIINLTKALCFMSSQEPMRACMSGNISYFLKLSSQDLSPQAIYEIVSDNQELCCQLIQRAGVSKINDCINDYYKNTIINTGKSSEVNLVLLENTTHIEKIIIKPIESSEYQDLKAHFLQLSRKKTLTNTDFISEEWHYLLGNNSEEEFERIMKHISKNEDKDIEYIKLCKYITGHLIKTDSHNDFLFWCLKEIFKVSFKTQKEVLGWLIYSNDPRRFSVKFVSKFIEHHLINLVEYDQALSRTISVEGNLDFVLNLLSNLMINDVQICTVYDFIATLEALANFSDNSKVYDFFQKISKLMMIFDNADTSDFEELIKSERYNIFTENKMFYKTNKYNIENFNIKGAFKSSWDHFIRHHKIPTLYCYYKIDMIPYLIKKRISLYIKDTLDILIDAYKRKNYLFIKFYTRFITGLLDIIDNTAENRNLVYSIIEVLFPSKIPFFTAGFLEIVQHEFVSNYFENERGFFISEEVLWVLKYNDRFLYPVTRFFQILTQHKSFIKKYGIYLSYMCDYKYVHLKNIFNLYRDNISYVEEQNDYFKIRRLLQTNTLVIREYVKKSNFVFYAIDNLNEKNIVSMYASNVLKTLINEKIYVQRTIVILWIYYKCENVPDALKLYVDEIRKYDWVQKIIDTVDYKFIK